MRKTLPILNIIALIATVAVSYLSVTGIFNGNTMAIQSARYPTLFTPAPWAFSIWGLIYLSLIGFLVYQARDNEDGRTIQRQVSGWFLLTCLANSAWVIAWMYDQASISVLIMIALLFCLFRIIRNTNMELTDPPLRTIASVWWPFCLYSGWITVALLANISAWLVKLQYTGSQQLIAIGMAILAGLVYLYMTWTRNMREYALVGVWALIAVGVADKQQAPSVTTVCYIIAAILFLSSSIHGYMNRALGPFRKREPFQEREPFRKH